MTVLTLDKAMEQAFTIMSGAKDINYQNGPNGLIAKHTKVGGKICYDFTLTRGNCYEKIRAHEDPKYSKIPTDKEVQSLKIATQPLPKMGNAVVTTILTLPSKSYETDLNNRIREATKTGMTARDFLKQEKHHLGRLQADVVGLGLDYIRSPFRRNEREFELTVNNLPDIEQSLERKPSIVLVREFNETCGLKTIANHFENLDDLILPLSAQVAEFNDYLD